MNINRLNWKIIICLLLVLMLAALVRFYRLDQIPPSLNWDEIAAGYNGYTIANWGKDEWGKSFPLVFTSFRDDKHPVHIYTAAIFIKLFGLSDFVARSPGALFGVLNVLIIFFLAKILFKSNIAAIFSALLLAISPFDIHFSRGLWEINFALFYFMLGLLLFYMGIEKKNWLLALAFISFDLSLLSYHSSKVVVPVSFLVLVTLYFKQLINLKAKFYVGLGIFLLLIVLMVLDPRLAGLARVNQTKFNTAEIQRTEFYQRTHSENLALVEIIWNQYWSHFSWNYLYQAGDQNPRNSIKVMGEFYQFEVFLLLIGLVFLIWSRSKITIVLLVWLLLAPLPSAAVQGAPNASRALFMLGVFQLIEGWGAAKVLNFFKQKKLRYGIALAIVLLALIFFKGYTDYYFSGEFAKKDAVEWQYGMKPVVEFFQKYPDYARVYVTDVRSQPYIFFLYYLKYPLPKYLSSVQYNQDPKTNKFNLVYSFDKYQFGGWDQVQSMPDPGLAYVIEDSKYGGLAHINDFARVEKIKNPDGSVAFYIVSKY